MKKNEGTLDRVLRVSAGVLILIFVSTPWNYIGIVPILTGLVGVCPLYTLIGLNTCPRKTDS